MSKDLSPTWKALATITGGILLSLIAWEMSRAVDSLRDIERSLAVAVQQIQELDRRTSNLEALFLKPER